MKPCAEPSASSSPAARPRPVHGPTSPSTTLTERNSGNHDRAGASQAATLGLEPSETEDAVCAVPGSFTLIDRQGCEVLFRPLVQADRPTVARLFPELSAQTRFRRFNSLYANLSDKQLTSLFDLDYRDRFAWAVEITCDGVTDARGSGTVRPVRRQPPRATSPSRSATSGTVVVWGSSLLDTLIITAHHHGFVAFETIVTADNEAMLHLLRQRGAELSQPTSGEVDVVLPLSGIIGQLTDHPLSGR